MEKLIWKVVDYLDEDTMTVVIGVVVVLGLWGWLLGNY